MTNPIVADRVRLDEDASGATLRCRLTAGGLDVPGELWYRVPPNLAGTLAVRGDPFLPVALLAGMKHHRDVVIDGEVSPELSRSVARIMEILHAWSAGAGDDLAIVRVDAPLAAPVTRGTSTGAFFSGGVDSLYTLLRNIRRYPAGDPRLISHLVFLQGFDIDLQQADLLALATGHARRTAQDLDKELVPVSTNARSVLAGVDWGHYAHAAVMAAAGLSLSGLFHTLLVPSSYHFFELFPWASHPALDPLWSTEQLEFVHDGGHSTRGEKVQFIATSPAAMRSLRVCWENPGGAFNCGTCEKCLRTMTDLYLCGALDHSEVFPRTIDPRAVARLTLTSSPAVFWRGALQRLMAGGADPRLADAIQHALRRGAWAESWLGRAFARWTA